jgi:hypothetical protein
MGLFSKRTSDESDSVRTSPIDNSNILENYLIPISEISIKQHAEIIASLEKTRKILEKHGNNGYDYQRFYKDDDGKLKFVNCNPFLPLKTEKENVLWYRVSHKGLLDRKLAVFETVTNFRVYIYDIRDGAFDGMEITREDDVVVNNQKRISESHRDGTSSGFSRGYFTGSSQGFSTSESQTIGDVNLLNNGEIVFKFDSVSDPHGLAKLIDHVIDIKKELVKLENQTLDKSTNKMINCAGCGKPNPTNSKFCNHCGNKFTTSCTKCNKINPSGSSFCNNCGFSLQ